MFNYHKIKNLTKPNRQSIRLRGYDYSSPGYYFITACTQNRECLFGDVVHERMALNGAGTIVGLFKSECTKQIRRFVNKPELRIWQRNYYEHIIRTEIDLEKIREYIQINPQMWDRDRNNPAIRRANQNRLSSVLQHAVTDRAKG